MSATDADVIGAYVETGNRRRARLRRTGFLGLGPGTKEDTASGRDLEVRRRTKTIPHAFAERAVLKLIYADLIRASDTWRRVVIPEFEVKPMSTMVSLPLRPTSD